MKFVYVKDLDRKNRSLFGVSSLDPTDKVPVFVSLDEKTRFEAGNFEQPEKTTQLAEELFAGIDEQTKFEYGSDAVYNRCVRMAKEEIAKEGIQTQKKMLEEATEVSEGCTLVVGDKRVGTHEDIDALYGAFANDAVAREFISKNSDISNLHIVEHIGTKEKGGK